MLGALVGLALLWGQVMTGQASYYADGVMDRVWAYRARYMRACAHCLGFVAMVEPERIGLEVWLRPLGGKWIGPYLVIDCARAEDRAGLYAAGRIVEVSRELARTWGMRGPVAVDLRFSDPFGTRARRLSKIP